MTPLSHYRQPLSLLTDLYQLTMAQGYVACGMAQHTAVFHLFFRRPPFQGGFTIASGLESVIAWINNFKVSQDDLDYLATLKTAKGTPLFCESFLRHISDLRFTGNLDAVPEGTVVFPHTPLLRVEAPLVEAQLLESALLTLVNFPTLIATKAARIAIAAQGAPVLEFGLRRAQGIDGALTASRAAYLGGCSATSNVLAGKLYGIPLRGTHAHSWVMAFEDELEAFRAYAKAMPDNALFLVDTYNSLEGVKKAIAIAKELSQEGHRLLGIRLDSGDLAYLSIQSRQLLDAAGFSDAVIVASNELDEILISELIRQGACIDVWGVGTHLVTSTNQPALDGVYKLSAIRPHGGEWRDAIKLSEQLAKINNPGILQVRRYSRDGINTMDLLYDIRNPPQPYESAFDPQDPTQCRQCDPQMPFEDLLLPIFREGKLVYQSPTLEEMRTKTQVNLAKFNMGIKRFFNPHLYRLYLEARLYSKKIELLKKMRGNSQDL